MSSSLLNNEHLADESGMSRRGFLKFSALVGGGVAITAALPAAFPAASVFANANSSAELNTFVELLPSGRVKIYASNPDMGQGVRTSIPMIIAEEMCVDWNQVEVAVSPVAERFGAQSVGGSTTVPREFDGMRQMGAAAREMFISAAAKEMKVPAAELRAENSRVIHSSGKSVAYADLLEAVTQEQPPAEENLEFKPRSQYQIIGSEVGSIDNPDLVTGQPQFGSDVQIAGMMYGNYSKCPAIGGKVVSTNIDEIKALPGIHDAFIVKGNGMVSELLDGVAIVGSSTWAVFEAKKQLEVEWDETNASKDSWTDFQAMFQAKKSQPGAAKVSIKGDVDAEFARSSNTVVAGDYQHAFVAHACMEPENCTADYQAGSNGEPASLELWYPSQFPGRAFPAFKKLFGLEQDQVTVHQLRMGGSFGRKTQSEFGAEAIAMSKRVGAPVKNVWTREDSMRNDFFRAGGFQSFKAALDDSGNLVAWQNHFFGFDNAPTAGLPAFGSSLRAAEFPMLNLDNVNVTATQTELGTPCGAWRAPGANYNGFQVQSFLHECAIAAKRDHVEFMLSVMGEPRLVIPGNSRALHTGRAADVIKLAAEKGGWGRAMPAGEALGFAFHFSHSAHVAEVVHLRLGDDRKIEILNVTAAIDIGPVINMSGARGQAEGAIIDGISAMMAQKITMEHGRIEQTNFDRYPVARMPNAPRNIDVHFIQSDNHPTGIGEPALPPLAAAVANAVFSINGHRIRQMPFSEDGYSV